MTTPAQSRRSSGYGGRTYLWPPGSSPATAEFEVQSVTTLIGKGLPKPFLAPWSAKMVAEYAVQHVDDWAGMSKRDPKGVVDMLKRSVYRSTAEKADMGTIAHASADAYIAGKPLTEDQFNGMLKDRAVPLDRWKATKGYAKGALEFLMSHEPEVLHNEATVYSRKHGYAGTLDLLMKLRIGGAEHLAIGDFKTSKSIYAEVGLQLSAYANADFIGLNDGTEIPLPGPIEHGVAIRLTPSGQYEAVAFSLTPDLFDVFLACAAVARGQDVMERAKRPTF